MNTVSEFNAEAPWATASKGLAQDSYVASEWDSNPRPFGRRRIYQWATMPQVYGSLLGTDLSYCDSF